MRRKCNRFQMGFKRGVKAGRHLLVLANQIKLRCANNFFPFVIATGMSIAVVHGRDSSVVGQLTSLTGQIIMSETALAGALLNLRQPLELDLKLSEPRLHPKARSDLLILTLGPQTVPVQQSAVVLQDAVKAATMAMKEKRIFCQTAEISVEPAEMCSITTLVSQPAITGAIVHDILKEQPVHSATWPDSADRERSSGALFLKKHIKLHSSSSNWLTDAAYLNHGFVPSSLSPSESGWGRSVGTKVLERSNYVYSNGVRRSVAPASGRTKYDIEASNLVTDRMSSANTVNVPAKFSSGTFH
ncbi:uncharacterized protein F5891DRAFT_1173197 [Suillus fuscotomentosus]|uniref:Uncharacterized protein n=1 Tax=Suillus fuscotomentosus TaxID=1912939 RepID=A0AAD4E659_9AGAM|nr:uncharacterized protein F5891DRAFT_1173197 [Suillus fuscotomentosus]KAG1900460.1 hypothetical protein F5891DRAFT_1173197 [Suillus fuscotomentosus]